MSFDLFGLLNALAPYLITAFGGWLLTRLRKPQDHERAALLVMLADSVTATLVAQYPNKPALDLLRLAVTMLRTILGTANYPSAALEREAVRALTKAGYSFDGLQPRP